MTELGLNGPLLIAYLINFVILAIILGAFAYKPLIRLMDQRASRIQESLEAAERAQREAANSRAAVEEQLNEARREGQRLLEHAREAAERFRQEEMERARRDAEAFVTRARVDIARERDAAIEEVRANFGDLAITAAERIIHRSLDRMVHQELIEQVLVEGESLRGEVS